MVFGTPQPGKSNWWEALSIRQQSPIVNASGTGPHGCIQGVNGSGKSFILDPLRKIALDNIGVRETIRTISELGEVIVVIHSDEQLIVWGVPDDDVLNSDDPVKIVSRLREIRAARTSSHQNADMYIMFCDKEHSPDLMAAVQVISSAPQSARMTAVLV